MTAPGIRIAKSGWLYRQSSMLKKWRRYYFSLSVDGTLRYFETEFETKAEGALHVPSDCIAVKIGTNVAKAKPPEGLSENFMLSLETSHGKTWIMCGENEDEIKAWQLALEEARHIMHRSRSASAPPPGVVSYGYPQVPQPNVVYVNGYGMYGPRNVVYTNYPGQVVIYNRDRYNYGYCGPFAGAATGLIAGAAIGSLMWTPFLWC
ncbi:pleckstrin y domain containing, B (evectins) member 2 [Chamberlinius hualienensis]